MVVGLMLIVLLWVDGGGLGLCGMDSNTAGKHTSWESHSVAIRTGSQEHYNSSSVVS